MQSWIYIYSNPKKDRKVSSYFNVLKLLFYLFGGDNITIYSQSSAGIPHPGWTNSYDWHIEPQLASNGSGTFFVKPSNHASGPIHINTWMHLRILVNQNRPGQGFEHHFPLIFSAINLGPIMSSPHQKLGPYLFWPTLLAQGTAPAGRGTDPASFLNFPSYWSHVASRGRRPFSGSQMTQPECYTF